MADTQDPRDLDAAAIEFAVLEAVRLLQEEPVDGRGRITFARDDPSGWQAWAARLAALLGRAAERLQGQKPPPDVMGVSAELKRAEGDARKLISRPDVLAVICPALKSLSGDAHDVAGRIIAPLAVAGLLGAPGAAFDVLSLAWAAIIIARMGVATVCRDAKGEGDKGAKP